MDLFIAARQSLTAIDAVVGKIARAMGLFPQELWVLMLMTAANEAVSGSWLAWQSGRSRQQLHRTLLGLEARGLVVGVGDGERVSRWVLTDVGLERARRLRAIVRAWEEMVTEGVDLAEVESCLRRVVPMLVNHFSSHGWRTGLHEPWDVRRGDVPIDGSAPWHEMGAEQPDLFAQHQQPLDLDALDPQGLVDDEGDAGESSAQAVLAADSGREGGRVSRAVLGDDSAPPG